MRKFKRLNRKGFTLIELLAVIVILAIVMGISATSVLRSINQSRTSSLLSAAQNAANTLNTWASEDALITDTATQHIGTNSAFYKALIKNGNTDNSNKWICMADTQTITNGGAASVSIIKALGLSDKDINVSTTAPTNATDITKATSATTSTCSAIRYNSKLGGYEVLLVAKEGGKFYVAGEGTNGNHAFNRASKTGENLSD